MPELRALLFPPEPRRFAGQRWVNVALRSVHLCAVAGLGAGFLHGLPPASWQPWLWVALASGSALGLLFVWSDGRWLVQPPGLAVLAKLGLLGLTPFVPAAGAWLFLGAVALSSVFAHAPARVRHCLLLPARWVPPQVRR
ncbi:MAG TPA: hypothetical protein PLY77_06030 [Plasticicumulans sp.]|nr:hypothetical protein [Plasticicumulans sp.]HNF66889.1 hypothetical protein [Plasticicumulans sp.]HNJ07490.1 hypothetical protein [Plasticicumulans sp.]